jgi:glutamate---cysteine ligase / carboxylate-amine ligase
MELLIFKPSTPFTIGIELELQIVNTRDYNLTRGAPDLLARLEKLELPGAVKPEIAESMIELNSAVHERHATLVDELKGTRNAVVAQAERLNLAVAGGGTHPFQKWSDQRIYPTERFRYISDLYGYLAKQFTVFGQHIHIGCADGDDAVYLTQAMSRYIPHFIALSASSPFYQGVDTTFDSARLNAVNAFPLSGCMPFVQTWDGFNEYFSRMVDYKIVASMKDFYWDIRPKPEYGTVEIRVCDTPLTVDKAASLAAYAQALARMLLIERVEIVSDVHSLYNYNRFQACRFGLHGYIIDPYSKNHVTVTSDIVATLARLAPHARALEATAALEQIGESMSVGRNDTAWLRDRYQETQSFTDVVRAQVQLWASRGDRKDT